MGSSPLKKDTDLVEDYMAQIQGIMNNEKATWAKTHAATAERIDGWETSIADVKQQISDLEKVQKQHTKDLAAKTTQLKSLEEKHEQLTKNTVQNKAAIEQIFDEKSLLYKEVQKLAEEGQKLAKKLDATNKELAAQREKNKAELEAQEAKHKEFVSTQQKKWEEAAKRSAADDEKFAKAEKTLNDHKREQEEKWERQGDLNFYTHGDIDTLYGWTEQQVEFNKWVEQNKASKRTLPATQLPPNKPQGTDI